MTPWPEWDNAGVVAGVRLAASAQPPRATSSFTPRFASSHSPQPISPFLAPSNHRHASGEPGCCGLPPAPPKQQWVREKTCNFGKTDNDS